MDHRHPAPFWQSVFLPVVLMLVAVIFCALTMTFTVDTSCVNHGNQYHRVFAGSRLVEQTASFMRPNGAGITTTVSDVNAHPLLVTGWHTAITGTFPDRFVNIGPVTISYQIERVGGLTRVTQQTRCMQ